MDVNSKMTALADEIRELSGTTTTKSIDTMTADVDAANTEIAEQVGLIAQIANALDGKAAGSGGSGGVETCSVTINAWAEISATMWYTNSEQKVTQITFDTGAMINTTYTVAKGFLYIAGLVSTGGLAYVTTSGGVTRLSSGALAFEVTGDGTISC
jgi:hypothetical protein